MLRPRPAAVHYFLTHFQWFWDFINSCFLRDTFMTLVLTGRWNAFKGAQLKSYKSVNLWTQGRQINATWLLWICSTFMRGKWKSRSIRGHMSGILVSSSVMCLKKGDSLQKEWIQLTWCHRCNADAIEGDADGRVRWWQMIGWGHPEREEPKEKEDLMSRFVK